MTIERVAFSLLLLMLSWHDAPVVAKPAARPGVQTTVSAAPPPIREYAVVDTRLKNIEKAVNDLSPRQQAVEGVLNKLSLQQASFAKKFDEQVRRDAIRNWLVPLLTALIAAGVPAAVAVWVAKKITKAQNVRQNELQEIQIVEKFLPYFEKGGDSVRAALIALWGINRKDLVLHLVKVFASLESAVALEDLLTREGGSVLSDGGKVLAQTWEVLARVFFVGADYVSAEYLYRKALKIRKERNEAETIEYATDLREMALALSRRGYFHDAEREVLEAHRIASQVAKGEKLAQFKNDVGTVSETLGKYDQSEGYFVESIKLYGDAWEEQPGKMQTRTNLATVLERKAQFDDAEKIYRDAIEFYDQRYGPINELSGLCQGNLGLLLRKLGRADEAEKLLRRSLYVKTLHFGPDHREVISGLTNLADLLIDQRQFEEGNELASRAEDLVKQAFGEESLRMCTVLALYAKSERLKGNIKEAIRIEERAIELTERAVGADHAYVAGRLLSLSSLYMNEDRFKDTVPILERALKISIKTYGETNPQVDMARIYLAECILEVSADFAKARKLLDEALLSVEQTLGKNHPEYAQILSRYGGLLLKEGKSKEAEERFMEALKIQHDNKLPDDISMANTMCNLGMALWKKGELDDGLMWSSNGIKAMERILGTEHPMLIDVLRARLSMLTERQQTAIEAEQVRQRIAALTQKFRAS